MREIRQTVTVVLKVGEETICCHITHFNAQRDFPVSYQIVQEFSSFKDETEGPEKKHVAEGVLTPRWYP